MVTNRPPQAGAAVRSVPDARRRRTILAAVCIALMAPYVARTESDPSLVTSDVASGNGSVHIFSGKPDEPPPGRRP
jgi:hypothetical protein